VRQAGGLSDLDIDLPDESEILTPGIKGKKIKPLAVKGGNKRR
jgi:hypothetical protein